MKIEHAINTTPNTTAITLMGLTKAFVCVNRKMLWATLYKLGLPIQMITHIKNGHQNTTLKSKDNGKYGKAIKNNVGVFQGATISPLLFDIYLEDMNQDYQALNDLYKLPQRTEIQAHQNIHVASLLDKIKHDKQDMNTPKTQESQQKSTYEEEAPGNFTLFADDTNIITQHDNPAQIVQKLKNYETITRTRQLSIQWEMVAILTRKSQHAKIKAKLPPEMTKVQAVTNATILGKVIDINQRNNKQ